MIDGAEDVDKALFEGAYEAFRLAAVMDPANGEAREWLARIKTMCEAPEDLEKIIETTGKKVEEKELRFDVGARVACNTGRTEDGWEGGGAPRGHAFRGGRVMCGHPFRDGMVTARQAERLLSAQARSWPSTTASPTGRPTRSCPTRRGPVRQGFLGERDLPTTRPRRASSNL